MVVRNLGDQEQKPVCQEQNLLIVLGRLVPVDSSFQALAERPKSTVRRHKFNKDAFFFISLTRTGLEFAGVARRPSIRIHLEGLATFCVSLAPPSPSLSLSLSLSPPPRLPNPR